MSKSRVRFQVAVLAFLLVPAVAGVLAVHASATCERFVRQYVTKPVRNRVSKDTAAAWAAWRVGHPNWKPNPNVHRPKYVMNRDETMQKVAFACSVPVIPSVVDGLLQTAQVEPPPPVVDLSRMTPTQITIPSEIPPEISEITPDNSWPPLGPFVPPILGGPVPGGPVFPIVPPVPPPLEGAVPEPASLLLAGSGIAFVGLMVGMRLRRRDEGTTVS